MRDSRVFLIAFITLASLASQSEELRITTEDASSENKKTIDVAATGVGTTSEAALDNAFRNAVENAVGLYVDAHTMVQNDQVLQDKVFTHSNGFVEKYDKISEKKRSDGLYEIRINVLVRKNQLIDEVKAANITLTKVDTSSLYAKIVTQNQSTKDAKTLLADAISRLHFPVAMLKARITADEPKLLEKSDQTAKVQWPLEISIDESAYFQKIVPALQQVLKQIAVKRAETDIIRNATKGVVEGENPYGLVHPLYDSSLSDDTINKPGLISVVIHKSVQGDNMRLWWCNLDEECTKVLFEQIAPFNFQTGNTQPVPPLHIAWMTKDGNAIIEDAISIADINDINFKYGISQWSPGPENGLRIGPFIYIQDMFASTMRFSYTKEVSLEELKQIVQMKCYFSVPESSDESKKNP